MSKYVFTESDVGLLSRVHKKSKEETLNYMKGKSMITDEQKAAFLGEEFTVNAKGGKKQTGNKPTFNQVPETFVAALSKHMEIGAQKYGFKNWTLGLTESQALEATRRHVGKRRTGENLDPETGSSHFLAIAANAMMAWCLEQAGQLTDDRETYFVDFKKETK